LASIASSLCIFREPIPPKRKLCDVASC
jgi:hypothetical protein